MVVRLGAVRAGRGGRTLASEGRERRGGGRGGRGYANRVMENEGERVAGGEGREGSSPSHADVSVPWRARTPSRAVPQQLLLPPRLAPCRRQQRPRQLGRGASEGRWWKEKASTPAIRETMAKSNACRSLDDAISAWQPHTFRPFVNHPRLRHPLNSRCPPSRCLVLPSHHFLPERFEKARKRSGYNEVTPYYPCL